MQSTTTQHQVAPCDLSEESQYPGGMRNMQLGERLSDQDIQFIDGSSNHELGRCPTGVG